MENNDFDKFEKVPTGALKEIKTNTVDDITGNTQNATESIFSEMSGNTNQKPDDSFPGDFGKYNGQLNNPGSTGLNAGNLVTGETAVMLFDIVMPTAFVMLMKNYMNKTVNRNAYTLTASEKKTLEPVIQSCLNSINFNVNNPWNALLLTAGIIYGMKTVDVINNIPAGRTATVTNEPIVAASTGAIRRDGRGRPPGTTKDKLQQRKQQSR